MTDVLQEEDKKTAETEVGQLQEQDMHEVLQYSEILVQDFVA